MLDAVTQFLADEINDYALSRTGSSLIKVVPGQVVNGKGEYAIDGDTVGVTVINIEEERVLKSQLPEHKVVGDRHVILEPELKLNLYLLFSANYNNYTTALQAISKILLFFQSHQVFTPQEYPRLDGQVARLALELQSLNYEQLNQLWGFLGGKQLPSVLYKARMIALQDVAVAGVAAPVKSMAIGARTA